MQPLESCGLVNESGVFTYSHYLHINDLSQNARSKVPEHFRIHIIWSNSEDCDVCIFWSYKANMYLEILRRMCETSLFWKIGSMKLNHAS